MSPEEVEIDAVVGLVAYHLDQIGLQVGRVERDESLLESVVDHPVEERHMRQLVLARHDVLDKKVDLLVDALLRVELERDGRVAQRSDASAAAQWRGQHDGRAHKAAQTVHHTFVAFGAHLVVLAAFDVLGRLALLVVVQRHVLRIASVRRGQTQLEDGLVAAGRLEHVAHLAQIGGERDLLHQIDGLAQHAIALVRVVARVQRLFKPLACLETQKVYKMFMFRINDHLGDTTILSQ